jgi:hypothetical protein
MEMDYDIGTFAGEVESDGSAEAFGCTGDQSDFSSEVAAVGIGGGHRLLKK